MTSASTVSDVPLCFGRIAAAVARGCAEKSPEERTFEFVTKLVTQFVEGLSEEDAGKVTALAKRVLLEVVETKKEAAALEAWAAEVENKENVFEDDDSKVCLQSEKVADKARLLKAVKELGMSASALKGIPKEDERLYCKELQKRIFSYIGQLTGETVHELPSSEEMAELKLKAEAQKELAGLDASNIIAAIKQDIARDMEREAARAASSPSSKKQKTKEEGAEEEESEGSQAKNAKASSEKEKAQQDSDGEDSDGEDESAESGSSGSDSESDDESDEDGSGDESDEEEADEGAGSD